MMSNETWRPEGYEELSEAQSKLSSLAARNRDWQSGGQWEKCNFAGEKKAREAAAALVAKYPAAQLWRDAEAEIWSAGVQGCDNTGKVPAAEAAMEILRNGGSIEDATAALAVRTPANPGL